jgi:hypothetical protein
MLPSPIMAIRAMNSADDGARSPAADDREQLKIHPIRPKQPETGSGAIESGRNHHSSSIVT